MVEAKKSMLLQKLYAMETENEADDKEMDVAVFVVVLQNMTTQF